MKKLVLALAITLSLSVRAADSDNPNYIIRSDIQRPADQFTIDRAWLGNNPFIEWQCYSGTNTFALTGWSLTMFYSREQYSTSGVYIASSSVSGNKAYFTGSTQFFNTAYNDYWVTIRGVNGGLKKTFGTGRLVVDFDPFENAGGTAPQEAGTFDWDRYGAYQGTWPIYEGTNVTIQTTSTGLVISAAIPGGGSGSTTNVNFANLEANGGIGTATNTAYRGSAGAAAALAATNADIKAASKIAQASGVGTNATIWETLSVTRGDSVNGGGTIYVSTPGTTNEIRANGLTLNGAQKVRIADGSEALLAGQWTVTNNADSDAEIVNWRTATNAIAGALTGYATNGQWSASVAGASNIALAVGAGATNYARAAGTSVGLLASNALPSAGGTISGILGFDNGNGVYSDASIWATEGGYWLTIDNFAGGATRFTGATNYMFSGGPISGDGSGLTNLPISGGSGSVTSQPPFGVLTAGAGDTVTVTAAMSPRLVWVLTNSAVLKFDLTTYQSNAVPAHRIDIYKDGYTITVDSSVSNWPTIQLNTNLGVSTSIIFNRRHGGAAFYAGQLP